LRGRSAFLALFMSVALATTLFSGILRGADAVDPLTRARDVEGFGDEVRALDPNVEGVDIAETIVRRASENVFLAGPKRVEELGVYFATLNMGMTLFSIALGLGVCLVMLRGENVVYNAVARAPLSFPALGLGGSGDRGGPARAFDGRTDTAGREARVQEPSVEDRGMTCNDVRSCEAWP